MKWFTFIIIRGLPLLLPQEWRLEMQSTSQYMKGESELLGGVRKPKLCPLTPNDDKT